MENGNSFLAQNQKDEKSQWLYQNTQRNRHKSGMQKISLLKPEYFQNSPPNY
nr:MAG TPA: hypothetical protein [Caudoviricetes sp.]